MQENARQMRAVNDCAERGIALVEEYSCSLTKDEEQKQFSSQACRAARETVSSSYKSYNDEADR